ncbi:hypothetical protein K9M59_02010 [Candidatus Gracilibacteria bacterium]|nr:hypothetical protein [Candidatus Gracilibacteria bacterium]MCF7819623.1 hypothetical protein [Candidatus Gracilibacteria bacterium]
MKKILPFLAGMLGLLFLLYGISSAILWGNVIWYSFFVIGGTLFLGWMNFYFRNNSIFEKSFSYILKAYVLYLVATLLIEYIGREIFGWWYYPEFSLNEKIIHVFLIGYPFGLFMIHESWKLIRTKISSFALALVGTTLINAFVAEWPNTFAWEWIYTVPYFPWEIFQINIFIIFMWVFLVFIPIVVEKILAKKFF